MKHQYVGDINDYRKYALLRVLSAGGVNRIGVCWMLTPDDGGADGGKLAYFQQPDRHRRFEPELFDILAHAAAEPNRRRLQTIEGSGAIPGAIYFNALLPDNAAGRQEFMDECRVALAEPDLIFFDPDNGVETSSIRPGRKNSSKYIFLDEIAAFYASGKSILIYQHFPRMEREAFITSCVERLRGIATDAAIWAFRTKHVVFLLLINPKTGDSLSNAATYTASKWDTQFIVGTMIRAESAMSTRPEIGLPAPAVSNRLSETPSELPPSPVKPDKPAERPSLMRRLLAMLR